MQPLEKFPGMFLQRHRVSRSNFCPKRPWTPSTPLESGRQMQYRTPPQRRNAWIGRGGGPFPIVLVSCASCERLWAGYISSMEIRRFKCKRFRLLPFLFHMQRAAERFFSLKQHEALSRGTTHNVPQWNC